MVDETWILVLLILCGFRGSFVVRRKEKEKRE